MNSILCSTCSGGPSPILKRSARVFHIPVMIICFRGADCSLLKTENGEWSLFIANSYFLFVYLLLINLPLSTRFGLFLAITSRAFMIYFLHMNSERPCKRTYSAVWFVWHGSVPTMREFRHLCRAPRTSRSVVPVMPQSHPTTGSIRFLAPVRFLAREAEWSAHRNFTWCCSRGHNQATGPVRLDVTVYLWFDRIIRMTPQGPRALVVQASCGPRTGIFNIVHILRDPYGARAGPTRVANGRLADR